MIFLVAIPVFILMIWNSIFVLEKSKQSVITEFGKLVKVINKPGLYFRIPFFQDVLFYEKRFLSCDISEVELTLGDQKRLVVDVFARYYIKNPVLFFKSVKTTFGAAKRLKLIIIGEVRDTLGKVSLKDLLSCERSKILDSINSEVTKSVEALGIGVMEIRIKKALFPRENNFSVFERMSSERMKEAQKWRGEAQKMSKQIKSEADLIAKNIVARAKKESEIIRGRADAEAMKIIQTCYGQDTEFARLLLSLQSYKKTLNNAHYYLSSNHPYFDVLSKKRLICQ